MHGVSVISPGVTIADERRVLGAAADVRLTTFRRDGAPVPTPARVLFLRARFGRRPPGVCLENTLA